jgi:O-antigen/teichoic acid export membrane protein
MTILALLADPIVRLLLTEKWLTVVPLLQWMCFARIFYPISVINMNILNAIGRSDLFLKVDLSKFPISLAALIVTVPLGVKAMVIGHVVTSFISYLINSYMPGKLFGYGALAQLRDMLPVFIATAITGMVVFVVNSFVDVLILKLLFGATIGLLVYFITGYILKLEELEEVKLLVKNVLNRK